MLGAVGLFCAAALGVLALIRMRGIFTAGDFLDRLPTRESTVVYLDFRVLRSAKLLDSLSPGDIALDPEYKVFIDRTGFDYLKDLDYLLVSFHPDAVFTFAGGRFDWGKLTAYAKAEGGKCFNLYCHMAGSAPERQISFFALRPNALAMAVGPDSGAAGRLREKVPDRLTASAPHSPAWVSFPREALRKPGPLQLVLRGIADAMPDGERVGIQADLNGDRFEITASVKCRSAQESQALKTSIEAAAATLRAEASKPESRAHALAALLDGAAYETSGESLLVRLPGALPAIRALLSSR